MLLHFWTHNYAISAGIKKAFLHITRQRFHKVFWLSNSSNPSDTFDVYRFRKILFGAVSSPFILYATLHYHLQQCNNYLSSDILHNLYVDNVPPRHSSEANIIHCYHSARSILAEAHFNLRAWVTNSPQLRAIIQQEKSTNPTIPSSVMGLIWSPLSDELSPTPKNHQ